MRTSITRPAALLIHSGGFTSRQWRRLAETLQSDFRVLTPDLLGYAAGEPWPAGKPFHFREDLAFLGSLVAADSEPIHLVGHSYGGFLALQFALSHPERVRSIAVYDPVAFGVLDGATDPDAIEELARVRREWNADAGGADEEWLAEFVDWWNGRGAWTHLPEETRAAFRAMGWKVFQEVLSLTADRTTAATYATIAAPTLVMGGEESPTTERRVVERLGALLPNAQVRLFSGAGHMGPISHARPVNDAIAEHLRAHLRSGSQF